MLQKGPVETRIWIQAGAFANRNNADAVAKRLNAVGNVEISSIDLSGSVVHRVRVGPIQEIDVADQALVRVQELGYTGAKIVLE